MIPGQPAPFSPPVRGESLDSWGTRALLYLLAHDGCTAPLSDDDLHQAERAARLAIIAPALSERVRQRLTDTRHLIARTLAARAIPTTLVPAVLAPKSLDKPNEGPMARLIDRPLVRPPAPSYATVIDCSRKPDIQF